MGRQDAAPGARAGDTGARAGTRRDLDARRPQRRTGSTRAQRHADHKHRGGCARGFQRHIPAGGDIRTCRDTGAPATRGCPSNRSHTNRERPREPTDTCRIQTHHFHRTGLFSKLKSTWTGAQGHAQRIPNGHITQAHLEAMATEHTHTNPGRQEHTQDTQTDGDTHRTNMPPQPPGAGTGTPRNTWMDVRREWEHIHREMPDTRSVGGTHGHTKFTDTQMYTQLLM